jgi:hypothetical protein
MSSDDEDLDKIQVETQEQEMAKYLMEIMPEIVKRDSNESISVEMTSYARQIILWKRETSIKSLVELCILRCIRPD